MSRIVINRLLFMIGVSCSLEDKDMYFIQKKQISTQFPGSSPPPPFWLSLPRMRIPCKQGGTLHNSYAKDKGYEHKK